MSVTKKTYVWLDLMRGLAALAVMAGHIRALTLMDYNPSNTGFIGKIFYFITGFGHQAVIIFFVLSGFLIAKSIHSSVSNNRWSLASYSVNRLSRLWTVLIPALLLTAFFDNLGMYFFADSLAYSGKISTLPGISPLEKSDCVTLIGNAFFLQGICVEVFGSNAPLWSLSYEFWYYFIFPLLYFSVQKNVSLVLRCILWALTFLSLWFIGTEASTYFTIWLMGAGASFYSTQIGETKFRSAATLFVFTLLILTLAFSRVQLFPIFFNDFSIGFLSALLVILLSNTNVKISLIIKSSSFLSNISYTVYLLHMPIAVFFSSWMMKERVYWGYSGVATFLSIFSIVMLFSIIAWAMFERNTYKVKTQVNSVLGIKG